MLANQRVPTMVNDSPTPVESHCGNETTTESAALPVPAELSAQHQAEQTQLAPREVLERRIATSRSEREQILQLGVYRELVYVQEWIKDRKQERVEQTRTAKFRIGMSIGATGSGMTLLVLGVALPPLAPLALPGSFLLGAGIFGFVPEFVRSWFGGQWRGPS